MPELPDVEAQRQLLADRVRGQAVARVRVPAPDVVRNTTPQGLGRALKGRRMSDPWRHGKWLVAPTEDGPALVLHFGMTGLLDVSGDAEDHPHDRVVLELEETVVRYRAMRKLGGVWLLSAGDELESVTGPLGPDAFDLSPEEVTERVAGATGTVKPALMKQARIAGLGNLLVDEICWRARVRPRAKVRDLSSGALAALGRETHAVLREAIPTGRVPPHDDWLTGARDDDDPACPRCGTSLRHATVGGRSTWWCPACQGP